MKHGRLIDLVGASGVGKDTVLRWLAAQPSTPSRVHIARRTITRAADDASEAHEAVSPQRFDALRRTGAFALDWEANGLCYGIRREELSPLEDGLDVIFNGSRGHLAQARRQYPELLVVRLTTPTDVLRARLLARGRESVDMIDARLARNARMPPFDVDAEVVNDSTPEVAGRRLLTVLGLDRPNDPGSGTLRGIAVP